MRSYICLLYMYIYICVLLIKHDFVDHHCNYTSGADNVWWIFFLGMTNVDILACQI